MILLVSQRIPARPVDVVCPPWTGVGRQTTFDMEMVCVTIGGSVITVLVTEAAEVVTTPPPMVTVVCHVSLYVTVTGEGKMVVGCGRTMGGKMKVQGGRHWIRGFGLL